MTAEHTPPEWVFEFHGHLCPLMPIGFLMGKQALEYLGADRERDHGLFVFPETGEGHPQTCLLDGIQAATGATYGKMLMKKTFYGKLAAMFYHPDKGAVRYSLKPSFMEEMGAHEFFAYRKKGIEPSNVPQSVAEEVIHWVYEQSDDFMFKVESRPDFIFTPVKSSFNKGRCSICDEYVFEGYLRILNGKPVCIPCSGQLK